MAKVAQIIPNKLSTTRKSYPLDVNDFLKSNPSHGSWSSCCALKVNNPADIIQIFQTDNNDLASDVLVTKFWSGSPADENLLSRGEYVLVEIKDKSNLVFKNKNELPAGHAENPKILIPYDTATNIGFSRLANVGVLLEKTETFTCTMEKVDTEEDCKGSIILHMNDQIFRLHTYIHDSSNTSSTIGSLHSNFNWKQSFVELFSFKNLFIMLLVRYGLGLANMKYRFMEGDLLKVWMKNAYMMIVDHFFHTA